MFPKAVIEVADFGSLGVLALFELLGDLFESGLEVIVNAAHNFLDQVLFSGMLVFILTVIISKVVKIERLLFVDASESFEEQHKVLNL